MNHSAGLQEMMGSMYCSPMFKNPLKQKISRMSKVRSLSARVRSIFELKGMCLCMCERERVSKNKAATDQVSRANGSMKSEDKRGEKTFGKFYNIPKK